MIEIIHGEIQNSIISEKLVDIISTINDASGYLSLGYPILPTSENIIALDALLITEEYGITAFIFDDGVKKRNFEEESEDIYSALMSKLAKEKKLIKRGQLLPSLEVIVFTPNTTHTESRPNDSYSVCSDSESFNLCIRSKANGNQDYYPFINRCIQSIGSMKKTLARERVTNDKSRGGKLKVIEKKVANLDNMQMAAAIEISDNVQRIRGLAGSGKTIILALKAAYLHTKNPNLKIAVTFNTRSLKQQFHELITRFVYELSESVPNWENLKIIHAWGSSNDEGIYFNFCKKHEIEYLDFNAAKNKSSTLEAFNYVCKKALNETRDFFHIYDIILIDEAQDFSSDFLKMCYEILPNKKRLVYAYDELQNLTKNSMDDPENIFGVHSNGQAKVNLKNRPQCAREDIILNVCYRNSRPILSTAHALGFRLYGKIIQMFDNSSLWTDIGYVVESGQLEDDKNVVLSRTEKSSPSFLEEHSEPDDLIVFKSFENDEKQIQYLVENIRKNLTEDELEYKDILVVHANPLYTRDRVGVIRTALMRNQINSHLAGVSTSQDLFFQEESITFTSIFRAKGNEAAMVYVIDSQDCATDEATLKSRNILFTAITRSKAWVRVLGVGEKMTNLVEEFNKIKGQNFKLCFNYPGVHLREHLRIIHREKTKAETALINKTINNFKDVYEALLSNKIHIADIPEEIRIKFSKLFNNE